MPQKKQRTSSKKKGKGSKRNSPNNEKEYGLSSLQALKNIATSSLPAFQNGESREEVGGYYEIYKASTTRFWDWMKEKCGDGMTRVNELRRGADKILEHNIAILDQKEEGEVLPIVAPNSIMADLSTSISYRERFTSARFGSKDGGDDGHRYIIEVLRYCKSVLKFGRIFAKVKMDRTDAEEEQQQRVADAIGGRFNALLIDDANEEEEDGDEETTEADIRTRKFPTYTGPEFEQEIDIQETLINGDDRFQAMALLHTMDDHMLCIDQHYGILKNYMRGRSEGLHDSTGCIKLLMECTAVANMAMGSVHAAENALVSNHPHLSSFYHVLALVILPERIVNVEKLMDKTKLNEVPHAALQFVAEVVECSFHHKGDGRIPAIVKKYSKKLEIAFQPLELEAKQIHMATSYETQLANEVALNAEINALGASLGLHTHTWLRNSAFIGGDRCILNTQNIVQKLMSVLQERKKLVGKPGFWGPHYHENTSPARCIRGGLDEPFASAIMPELIAICRYAPFQHLSDTSHLITVLDLLQKHVKGERTQPVPIALTFGLHAILTSILVLQGDGDLARLASYAKHSYNTLFEQLDTISDKSKPPSNAPAFYSNVATFKNLVIFAKPVQSTFDRHLAVDPAYSEELAFWNPVIGGGFMLYATYICSIGLGSATVDSLGQLRFTSHLYNALKQHNPSMKIPLLDRLDKIFSKTKAVWIGGRPEKGSYCKHFWMAWGMTLANASLKAAEHLRNKDAFRSSIKNYRGNQLELRDLDEIRPEEFSKSFSRLVQHDFAGEEGQADSGAEVMSNFRDLEDTVNRMNATRDAMDDDEDLLCLNFSVLGCILLRFVNELSETMGWVGLVNQVLSSHPEVRTGRTMGGKCMRGFTASDLNFKHQGLAHCWGHFLSLLDSDSTNMLFDPDTVMTFAVDYFQKISVERYVFFVEKEESQPKRRNPLEASYPYGRTGRTPGDPLHSILHFKFSKRGELSTRLVTPGKLASQDEDALPYEEPSKLQRKASGKYRHIASYDLDELLDLGWDGSFYTSTRGRHAASGHYVPFIPGYDSDSADEYEPIDVQRGKRAGTIGLSKDQIGSYMMIPDMTNNGEVQIVQLQDPKR